MRYGQEKERLESIRRLQNKRQELQVALQMAEARGDLARVADIRYGRFVLFLAAKAGKIFGEA